MQGEDQVAAVPDLLEQRCALFEGRHGTLAVGLPERQPSQTLQGERDAPLVSQLTVEGQTLLEAGGCLLELVLIHRDEALPQGRKSFSVPVACFSKQRHALVGSP